jgi:hypothetical protein
MANVNLRDLEHVLLGRARHCFALQGDLGLLAADTYLIPTDSYGTVEDHWEWAVGHDEHRRTRQLHDAAALLATRGFAWVDGAPAVSVLALNVAGGTTINDVASMIRRLSDALDALESRGLVSEFRARPLVAMPLIGVGQAGLGGRTGEVISALLGAIGDHFDRTPAGGFDMAIVTRDPSSIAAVQHARRERFDARSKSATPEWLDRIVRSARDGALAVMFGAGASASLGLPMWNELLARLVESLDDPTLADMDLTGLDPVDAATLLIEAGGAVWFAAALDRLLGTPRHSLTHGLIANLRCPLTITTNYDQAFEIAAQSITRVPLSVLPWDSDSGDGPRILKLHGDLSRGQLVLSRDQFVAMHAFRRPLAGVLQSRMLIGQLLAVGTSMSDATLVHAAEEFRALIEQAQSSGAASGSLTGASPDSAYDSSAERRRERSFSRHRTPLGSGCSSAPSASSKATTIAASSNRREMSTCSSTGWRCRPRVISRSPSTPGIERFSARPIRRWPRRSARLPVPRSWQGFRIQRSVSPLPPICDRLASKAEATRRRRSTLGPGSLAYGTPRGSRAQEATEVDRPMGSAESVPGHRAGQLARITCTGRQATIGVGRLSRHRVPLPAGTTRG